MTQETRINPFGDPRQRRRFLHQLLDAARGVPGVARGFK